MWHYVFNVITIALLVYIALRLGRKTSDCFAIMQKMQQSHEIEREIHRIEKQTWKDQFVAQETELRNILSDLYQHKHEDEERK